MRCLSFYFFPLFSYLFSSPSTTSSILVWGTTGNTSLLLATTRMDDIHLFCNPFLKEAVIHGVASCRLDSMSPTWSTSSGASSSVTAVTAETTIKWQKNAFGCPQERPKSCWKDCALADHKDSLSFLFPAIPLKEEEEKVAEASGGTRTTISDCCNCSQELWHSSQRLKHYLHKMHNCCLLCSYQFIAVKAINWQWTPFLPCFYQLIHGLWQHRTLFP